MSWHAASGLRSWLIQRLTALYIAFFLAIFAVLWGGQPITFELWRAWVAHPAANIALLLFIFSLLLHAWIGGRDIVMDYVKSIGMRYLLLMGFGLGLGIVGLWAVRILFMASGELSVGSSAA